MGRPGMESGTPPATAVGVGAPGSARSRSRDGDGIGGSGGDRGESGGLGFAGWTEGGCRLGDGAGRPGGLVASWAGRPSEGGSLCLLFNFFVSFHLFFFCVSFCLANSSTKI